jgi:hypothetical protein
MIKHLVAPAQPPCFGQSPAAELGESLTRGQKRMGASTRPPLKRHQAQRHLALSLVAVFLMGSPPVWASTPAIPFSQPQAPIATAPAAHDIAITTVKAGQEGLELSARFTEDSTETVRDVEWLVLDDAGTKVFNGITALADARLPPGDYQVSANYGAAHIVQGLAVHEGTKLAVSFILNAGGLRVLPRVKNLGLPGVASRSKVYALSGTSRGQLVATSYTPGEVLKMSAGDYRVESRFEEGNALVITDVHVRPGIMSSVNVDHVAGVAHLSTSNTGSSVNWTITDSSGIAISTTAGAALSLVLQPGIYKVEIVELKLTKTFKITQGEAINVSLEQ